MTDERIGVNLLMLGDHLGYHDGKVHGGTTYFLNTLPALNEALNLTTCFLSDFHPAADQLKSKGVKVDFLSSSKWDFRVIFKVLKIIKKNKINVIHLAGVKSHLLGRVLATFLKLPVVLHFHDTNPLPKLIRAPQRLLAPFTQVALIVSDALQRYVVEEYRIPIERIFTLYNGLDLAPFNKESSFSVEREKRKFGIDIECPVVGVFGRIVPGKGQYELIQAMLIIQEQVSNAVLVVIGDGAYRSACEILASELGIRDSVFFLGHQSNIVDLMKVVDVVVIPSTAFEAFPFVAIEALASSKPVVAFDSGGLYLTINDRKTGLLVETGNIEMLGASVIELLTTPLLSSELGAAGRLHVESFSAQKHVEKLVSIYKKVM